MIISLLLGCHRMRYFTLLITLSCLSMPSALAQKKLSINQYLRSAFTTEEVRKDAENASFLKSYNYKLPVIKSVDLRSETRDFLLKRQEYSLRVKPNSLGAISYQRKVYQNRIEGLELANELRFNEGLKKRYLSIIDYFFTQQILALEKEHHGQLSDKIEILSSTIYNPDFDVKELIEAEDQLLKSEVELVNLNKIQKVQISQLKQLVNFYGDSLQLDFSNLVNPEEIINNSFENSTGDHLSIKKQKLKLVTLENEIGLELAKSNQLLDFVQAKYGGGNDIFFSESLSIGIGLNIPFFGNKRQRKGDYYFEKLTEEAELVALKETVQYEQGLLHHKFENIVANFESMNNTQRNSSVSSIIEMYKKMDGVSPMLVLNLVSLDTKRKIESLKSKHELYITYIELLANRGKLFQQPLRNFLSEENELILR